MYLTPKIVVAVVGPFYPSEIATPEVNVSLLDSIYDFCNKTYGRDNYYFLSLGCDKGFGKDAKLYSLANRIRFAHIEAIIPLYIDDAGVKQRFGNAEDFALLFSARHAAIFELSRVFFLKISSKRSVLDDLIARVKQSDKPFYLYSEDNQLVEYRGDVTQNGKTFQS